MALPGRSGQEEDVQVRLLYEYFSCFIVAAFLMQRPVLIAAA